MRKRWVQCAAAVLILTAAVSGCGRKETSAEQAKAAETTAAAAAAGNAAAETKPAAEEKAAVKENNSVGLRAAEEENKGGPKMSKSDRIDKVLTHRVFGLLIFAAIMFLVFHFTFSENLFYQKLTFSAKKM